MALAGRIAAVVGGQRVGAFTTSEARAAGYTSDQIRTQLSRGRWQRLRRGVYAESSLIRGGTKAARLLRAEAAVLVVQGAAISHRSAAAWWGIEHLGYGDDPPKLTCAANTYSTGWGNSSVAVRVAELPVGHLQSRNGIAVTSPARSVADVARDQGRLGGLVIADSAMSRGRVTADELRTAAETMQGWPGAATLRWLVPLLDARAATPLESLCRFRWLQAGLPMPHLQAWIFDENGFVGIVDGLFTDPFVAYEADGMRKYEEQLDGPETLRREKLRQELVEATGLVLRRYTWPQLWNDPRWSVGRMRQAREEAARRPAPRVRIYVSNPLVPPPEPRKVLASRAPALLGLRLLYDGLH